MRLFTNIRYIWPLIGLLFILLRTPGSHGQNNVWFKHLSPKNGFPHSNINAIHQDKEGYLWIAAFDGLSKYDGYEVKTYRNHYGDSSSISSSFVTDITEDQHGNLWIATAHGISRFDKSTGVFTNMTHDPNNSNTINHNSVWSILTDSQNRIWIGSFGGGVDRIEDPDNFPNVQITHYQHASEDSSSLSQNWVMEIFEDSKGQIWVGTVGQSVNQYQPSSDNFKRILLKDSGQINNSIWSIEERKNGEIWFGAETGLSRYSPSSGQIKNFIYDPKDPAGISEGQIRAIHFDSRDNLWVGTQYGLNLYSYKTQSFIQYTHEEIDAFSISSDEAWCIQEDNQGTLWVGTYGGGISYFHPSYTSFSHVTYNPLDKNSIQGNNITSFYEDKNSNLWIAIDHAGVDYWDRKTNQITHYRSEKGNPHTPSGLAAMEVFEDSKGYVWIGLYNQGLNRLNPKTGEIKKYMAEPDTKGKLSNGNVWTIQEDENSNLWIGTIGGGLNRYDRATDSFSHYGVNPADSTMLNNENVWTILVDGDSLIWTGTSQGLNILDRKKGSFTRYQYLPNDSTSILNNNIETIYKDSKGSVWIGTQGGGLNLLNQETNSFSAITSRDGLANDNISGILEDSRGNLWVSTNMGISKINPKTGEVRNFTSGLNNNQFNLEACIKTRDGQMFFGGTNGYHFFHPDSIPSTNGNSKLVITKFQILNETENLESFEIASRDSIQTIELNHNHSVFSFEFSALNFIAPEQISYAYQLEPFEKDWIEAGADRRFVSYTNIPAGEYLFKVKSTNYEGHWNEDITKIRIIIKPPWWMSWWFKLYAVIAVLTFFYFAYQLRMKIIYNQKKALEEEVKHRTAEVVEQKEALEHQAKILQQYNQDILSKNNELKDLHRQKDGMIGIVAHDLKSPLSNIKGLVNLIGSSGAMNEDQEKYIQMIIRLINQGDLLISDLLYLNGMKQFETQVKIESFDILEFLSEWSDNYITPLDKKEQHLALTLPSAPTIVRSDKEVLRRILDNVFTNAMKFSERGKIIYLKVTSDESNWHISIRDEGPGISKEDQSKMFQMFQKLTAKPTDGESSSGLGLSIVKALVEKLSGEIQVNSELNKGTEFIISLPLDLGGSQF